MRVEPFSVGSMVHVVKRGARGLPIVRDDADRWRFLKMLYLLNDTCFDKNWVYERGEGGVYDRPKTWGQREELVDLHAFTLLPNHFHLLLGEVVKGGVSLYMKRLGQSMTNYSNEKYQERGSIFQGSYRSRTISDDAYLQYVLAYIMGKNTLELYPNGGIAGAQIEFESAWDWAKKYQFSSLADYAEERPRSPILCSKSAFGLNQVQLKSLVKNLLFSDKYSQYEKELY